MSDRSVPHVWQAMTATCWAMLPERVPLLFEIAAREHLGEGGIEAIAAKLGRPLDNTRAVTQRDGVAVIPVEGVIIPRASLFTDISGGVSVDTLAADFSTALNDPAVSSILLLIDSPGGDKNGVPELGDMIHAARGQKPIVAYVRELCASGAYWLAAATDEIVVAADAMVGSIGVVTAVSDPNKQRDGSIQFVSSQSPHKRIDPTTDAGGKRIQARVDAVAEVFIAGVARYRGVSVAKVASDFGQGDVLIGQAAVDAGLADRLGSFEGVVAELQARAREPRRIGSTGRMAARSSTGGTSMAQQEKGRFEEFMAWMRGEGEGNAFAATSSPPMTATANAYQPPSAPQPDPRLQAALEEIARMKAAESACFAASLDAEATAFAGRIVTSGRALPVEQGHLAALYRMAASDDAAHGAITASDGTSTSRVATLTAWQESRPTSAILEELVPVAAHEDGTLTTLTNQQATAFAAAREADAPMTDQERIAVMAMTPLGQAELRRRGIPIPAPTAR